MQQILTLVAAVFVEDPEDIKTHPAQKTESPELDSRFLALQVMKNSQGIPVTFTTTSPCLCVENSEMERCP